MLGPMAFFVFLVLAMIVIGTLAMHWMTITFSILGVFLVVLFLYWRIR